MRGHHDIGGLALGLIDKAQHDYALWEKRVDALLVLLAGKGLMTVDELRNGIETLGADQYERLTYYERWISSVTRTLVARGVLTTDELGRRMAEVAARPREPA
jgi:Nitrile hydratase beta subunit, N-terminal